jgi:cold shock CspA family protein
VITGEVASFDDHRGYGAVVDGEHGTETFFHCTAIADGTRTIAVGCPVTYTVAPGRLGRWEAVAVTRR